MLKKLRLFLFISFIFLSSISKSQNYEWLKSYGSKSKIESIDGVKLFPDGSSIFLMGIDAISDTFFVDDFKIFPVKKGSYLVKLDSNGKAKSVKYLGDLFIKKFCYDDSGNYYLGGVINNQKTVWGTDTLLKKNGRAFVAKLDKDYNKKWIKQTGNDTTSGINQLKFSNGRLYFILASYYSTDVGYKTYFLTKSTSYIFGELTLQNGQIMWSECLFISRNINLNIIDLYVSDIINLKNKLYLSGNIPAISTGFKISSDTFPPGAGFIIKTDSLGNYSKRFLLKSKNSWFSSLITDGFNLYAGGYYMDSFVWNGKKTPPEFELNGYEKLELLVISLTPDFKHRWYFRPKIIDKSEKRIQWNAIGNIYFNKGFLYLTGVFDTKMIIDSTIIEPKYKSNAFSYQNILIMKTDTLCNFLWKSVGGTVWGWIISGDVIRENSVILGGGFNDTISFGKFSKTSKGGMDGFITKITDYSITRGKVKQGPYCAGDTILIPYSKFGIFDTANTFFAQLSDEYGNFDNGYYELGRLKTNKDSTVIGVLPYFKVSSSANYRIRIRSTNPPVQSYYQFDKLRLLIYSRDKADPGGDETICRGDTVKLNTWGGTKWTWSPAYKMNDSTLRQPLVCPDTTTTYRIVIADSSGCGQPDTAFKKIIVRPIPRAIPDFNDSAICTNGFIKIPVNFKYGDSLNYSWKWFLVNSPKSYFPMGGGKGKLSDTLGVYTSVDNSYSQKFAVVLTDNCTAKSDTATVTISQRPNVSIISNFKDTSLCSGNALKYKAQAQGGIKKYYRYEWTDLNKNKLLSNSDSLIFTSDETLKIRLTVNDGCTELGDTLEFKVAVKPKLKISTTLRDTSLCSNQNLTAKAKGTGGTGNNYNFIWILNNKTIANTEQANINLENYAEGIYELKIILNDNCTKPDDTLKLKINILPSPKADYTYGIACSRTKTDFVFSGKKITNTTFEWDFNGESKAYTQDAKFMFSSGEKTVKLVAKSDFCSDTVIKTVTIKKQSKAEYSAADVCENDSAIFINSSLDADSYFWKFGDGKTVETISPLARQAHKYEIPQTTTFLVKLIAKSGCSDSVTNAITINKNPNAIFTFNQNGDKLNLNATAGFAQYKWKFNTSDSLITTTENYVHTLKNWSPVKVCLTVTDINNCTSETCQTIPVGISSITLTKGFKIYPNPNSGIFTFETNQTKPEIQVFDVLGKQISFTSNQISQNTTSIQIHAPQGIYFIKVNFNGKVWVERIIVS